MQALVEFPRIVSDANEWRDVCAIDDVIPGTGAAALIDGIQIAIIRTRDGRFAALSNFDPFSNAFVIARGIVGDRAGVPKIASPIYKQNFSLETGECLDDPSVRLAVYPVRVVSGRIQISVAKDSE
ncbi:MAG TPA: nitrite reductase small subunit NirD [Polyangiaceae bacterium]|jgi:nitrite reductase (NADH) small subunit|nr:nitrite reductase small subunit NirD [Polyangiaceae bacterium]